jgi:hypothetical protein
VKYRGLRIYWRLAHRYEPSRKGYESNAHSPALPGIVSHRYFPDCFALLPALGEVLAFGRRSPRSRQIKICQRIGGESSLTLPTVSSSSVVQTADQFHISLQHVRPATRFIDFRAQPITAFAVSLKITMFQFNFRFAGVLGNETNLYLTGSRNIREKLEISVEMPRKDQSARGFAKEHHSSVAFRAILILLIPAAAVTRFDHHGNHRAPSNMMFFGPPLAHILGKDRKRVFRLSVYDDCFSNDWICLLHLKDWGSSVVGFRQKI